MHSITVTQLIQTQSLFIVLLLIIIFTLIYYLNKAYLSNSVESKDFEEPTINITVDSLTLFFELQNKIQQSLGYSFSTMTTDKKEEYTKDMVLYLLEETHELLRETNFKSHKKVKKTISVDNIKDELADILHFFINLCIVWNVTPQELTTAFIEKNEKNVKRIESESY
jgi:NTP pyrophosphatase (non-canonical NTP hydrolase)